MSKEVAKPLEDNEVEFVDEDDKSTDEAKKAASGFTPTQSVSWPFSKAKPPEEPLSDIAAATGTGGEAAKVNKVLDKREEAEKTRRDDHRHDPDGDRHRGSFEARYARGGFTQQAGRHTAHTGPLTRGSGRLKVFADTVSAEQLDEWAEQAPELAKIAKQVLHGRSATIFEHRVLNRMLGQPERSVAELAAQFNVTPARVYKVEAKSLKKVEAAFLRHKQGKSIGADYAGPRSRGCDHPSMFSASIRDVPPTAAEIERMRGSLSYKQELAEEAKRENDWREYVTGALQRWENLYGPKKSK